MKSWTFGRKLGFAFGLVVVLTLLKTGVSAYALRSVVESKDRVITVIGEILLDTKDLQIVAEERAATGRSYLLSGDSSLVQRIDILNRQVLTVIDRLRGRIDAEELKVLDRLQQANLEYATALVQLPEVRKNAPDLRSAVESIQRSLTTG